MLCRLEDGRGGRAARFERADLHRQPGQGRRRENEFFGCGQRIGEIGREVDVFVEAMLARHFYQRTGRFQKFEERPFTTQRAILAPAYRRLDLELDVR